jgi:pyruvate-formate lyase
MESRADDLRGGDSAGSHEERGLHQGCFRAVAFQKSGCFHSLCGGDDCPGGGIPFLFNDDCFIKALSDHGIRLEDARNYAPIGCIELTIPGRANPHAVSGWFNSTKCLELALFDGQDPRTGRQLGPKTGTLADYKTFDDLLKAYFTQVEFFAKRMVYFCNRGELAQRERGPLPCWSILTDDCIKRGRDITDGGAVYNYHSICFLGTANTADSLMAVKKLLYDEKKMNAQELLQALKTNFNGMESLRKMLLTQAPKYGNDQPEVDALAARVADHFIDVMDQDRHSDKSWPIAMECCHG